LENTSKLVGNNKDDNLLHKYYDILVLVETFALKEKVIPGFYSRHILATKKKGPGRPSRGISVYFRGSVGKLLNSHLFENLVVLNFDSFTLIAAYLPHTFNVDNVQEDLILAFEKVPDFTKLIMCGDFNCRLDGRNSTEQIKGNFLLELAEWNNLQLLNTAPFEKTYIIEKGGSVIDLCFSGVNILNTKFKVLDPFLKKHKPIEVSFNVTNSLKKNPSPLKSVHKIDDKKYKSNLDQIYKSNLHTSLIEGDIDNFYDNIKSLIFSSRKEKVVSKRKSQPWFDKECFELKSFLDEMRHLIKLFPYIELNKIY